MPTDIYATCPCGSGKKIKFCCRDLAGEIEKIERMLEADQRQACLEHIEQLEKKYPNRTYLEATKADLLRSLGRRDEARNMVRGLLERESDNPVALAEAALAALSEQEEGVLVAIDRLQSAIEQSQDTWSEKVFEALAAVAHISIRSGYLLAGLGHMLLYVGHEPEDEGAHGALIQFCESDLVPLWIKEDRYFLPCEQGVEWQDEFDSAMALSQNGVWRLAAERLQELTRRAPEAPPVWYNLATLRGWLGQVCEATAALRQFAQLDVPLDDAVEAEALAILLDPEEPEDVTVSQTRIPYPIVDLEQFGAKLSIDSRVAKAPAGRGIYFDQTQPPPRGVFLLLDRVKPVDSAGLTLETAPVVLGEVQAFGKETDREPRAELLLFPSERVDEVKDMFRSVAGDTIGDEGEAFALEGKFNPQVATFRELWIPPSTPHDKAYELATANYRDNMLNRWPDTPQAALDGQTPNQAAADPQNQRKLLACVMILELSGRSNQVTTFDHNELRQKLNLPVAEDIDPAGLDVENVPLARLARLKMEKLSDDELFFTLSRAMSYRAVAAVYRAGHAVRRRPSLANRVQRPALFVTLATLEPDTRKALELIDEGRRVVESQGGSSAQFDLQELLLRSRRGEGEQVAALFQHLAREHINEPGVRAALQQLAANMGAAPRAAAPAPRIVTSSGEPVADDQQGKIWTPDSERPAGEGGESKIWTPGG